MKTKQALRIRRRTRSILDWACLLGLAVVELWMAAEFAAGLSGSIAGSAQSGVPHAEYFLAIR